MKSSCLKQGTQTEFSDIGVSGSSIFHVCNPLRIHDQIFPGKLCVHPLLQRRGVFTNPGWLVLGHGGCNLQLVPEHVTYYTGSIVGV